MKRAVLLLSAALLFLHGLHAQHIRFVTEGTIEYEKSVNTYAIFRKLYAGINRMYGGDMQDEYRKTHPQFLKLKSTLTFSKDKTLYKPEEKENEDQSSYISPMVKQNNIVYTDLARRMSISQKQVVDETYLLSDSSRKINWKITSEQREIAGYECRRANAVILDSVYVVAFYTDDIPVSGGPESFTGLPGMILGLALPHENITWFATKVNDQTVAPGVIKPPSKGKSITAAGLRAIISSAFSNWGPILQQALKAFLL